MLISFWVVPFLFMIYWAFTMPEQIINTLMLRDIDDMGGMFYTSILWIYCGAAVVSFAFFIESIV